MSPQARAYIPGAALVVVEIVLTIAGHILGPQTRIGGAAMLTVLLVALLAIPLLIAAIRNDRPTR